MGSTRGQCPSIGRLTSRPSLPQLVETPCRYMARITSLPRSLNRTLPSYWQVFVHQSNQKESFAAWKNSMRYRKAMFLISTISNHLSLCTIDRTDIYRECTLCSLEQRPHSTQPAAGSGVPRMASYPTHRPQHIDSTHLHHATPSFHNFYLRLTFFLSPALDLGTAGSGSS